MSVKPIVLLPLRLEIRQLYQSRMKNKEVHLAGYEYEDKTDQFGKIKSYGERKKQVEKKGFLPDRDEIWIRWYPDDCQVFPPVGKITGAEKKAYDEYKQRKSEDCAEPAWVEFVNEVGIRRARYLVDRQGTDPDWNGGAHGEEGFSQFMTEGAALKALSGRVALYTIHEDIMAGTRSVKLLAEGNEIADDIVLSANDLPKGRWAVDFEKAVEMGMGIKITSPQKLEQVKEADWLIAVGYRDDAGDTLAELFQRHKALGRFDIIRQGMPTNNTENTKTPFIANESGTAKEKEVYEPRVGKANGGHLTDGELFASRLGLDEEIMQGLENSYGFTHSNAGVIRRLLFEACTLVYRALFKLQHSVSINDSQWRFLNDHFTNFVSGGGLLPAVRIGFNPYGILPVTNLDKWKSTASHDGQREKEELVAKVCRLFKDAYLKMTGDVPAVHKQDSDKDVFDRLVEVLQLNPASHRVDVQIFQKLLDYNTDPRRMTCPLAANRNGSGDPKEEVTAYLGMIKDYLKGDLEKPEEWEIPGEDNTEASFLQRVLQYYTSYLKNTRDLTGSPSHGAADDFIQTLDSLIKLLEEERFSFDDLENGVIAVLDTLSYRLDAWITSLAGLHLNEIIESQAPSADGSFGIGVYGWLERPVMERGKRSDGYFQAPSLNQAITGAILRSAALSDEGGKEGMFQVNLSSERARKALLFTEGLQKGYSPAELLGYQAERKIHERGLDKYLLDLRRIYPLTGQEEIESSSKHSHVLDGEKFLAGRNEEFVSRSDYSLLEEVREEILQIQDAVADLYTAEALYQTVQGNVPRTAAWLEAIEGKNIPPIPEVVKTPRSGIPQVQRVLYPLPGQKEEGNPNRPNNPRAMAEPALQKFCAEHLQGYADIEMVMEVRVVLRDGEKRHGTEGGQYRIKVNIYDDLGLEPLDLVVAGKEELEKLVKIFIWKKLLSERKAGDWRFLGEKFLSAPTIAEFERLTYLELEYAPRLLSCLETAEYLNSFINWVEPLRPEELTDAYDKIIIAKAKGYFILLERARELLRQITEIQNGLARLAEIEEVDDFMAGAQDLLLKMSRFGLPLTGTFVTFICSHEEKELFCQQLRHILDGEISRRVSKLDDLVPVRLKLHGEEIRVRIRGNNHEIDFFKVADGRLDQEITDSGTQLAIVEKGIEDVVSFLKEMTACQTVPILPPFVCDETLVIREGGDNFGLWGFEKSRFDNGQFVEYSKVRAKLEILRKINEGSKGKMHLFSRKGAHKSKEEAFMEAVMAAAENMPDELPLPGEIDDLLPEKWPGTNIDFHYIVPEDGMEIGKGQVIAGFNVDEWTDFVPYETETTALAFQYETPRAQAPQALLLAVPPLVDSYTWNNDEVAEIVADTIDLMRIRAVSSETVIGSELGKLLPALIFGSLPGHKTLFPAQRLQLYNGIIQGGFFYKIVKQD